MVMMVYIGEFFFEVFCVFFMYGFLMYEIDYVFLGYLIFVMSMYLWFCWIWYINLVVYVFNVVIVSEMGIF